jgi:adenine-specific DNA-methyltransferase
MSTWETSPKPPRDFSGHFPLLERVDFFRLDASRRLDPSSRSAKGQFLTPPPVARLMASMFEATPRTVRLLDAGAGIGSLTAAFVDEMRRRESPPEEILVTAYEIDPLLVQYLNETFKLCREACERQGIRFAGEVAPTDFIEAGINSLDGKFFAQGSDGYTCAILNPPYRKINSGSAVRLLLRSAGIETTNLYAAFVALAVRLLRRGGELVAITPRSFCNGTYFKPFRKLFLDSMTFRRIHVFDSRDLAFREDQVLQENIIFHAVKRKEKNASVAVSTGGDAHTEDVSPRELRHEQLVQPSDPDLFIHIVSEDFEQNVRDLMARFDSSLADLGISVSTGRVVDFRARDFLRAMPEPTIECAPLIYPGHIDGWRVKWPREGGRKPNALVVAPETRGLLVPRGTYVLVRRFSAKEEPRRVVASVYDPEQYPAPLVGFENHLNYYHAGGGGLPAGLAKGLAAYLNSTLVDSYFRQFSGHTQVNAGDLRSLKYPSRAELESLGAGIDGRRLGQDELDRLIEKELLGMSDDQQAHDAPAVKQRIEEALTVLRELDFPRRQLNERSALTLLALLDLRPDTPWAEAGEPLRGITQMMDFFARHYGKRYAPNTREVVRRQTVHQFLEAGLIVANPDDPSRPTNSGKTVYQVETGALKLLRSFGSKHWEKRLGTYLSSRETLRQRYAQERRMKRIPVTLAPGKTISLSPGGQNVLVEKIISEFCPRFTPGATPVYVGDTDEKWAYFDEELLAGLGVRIEAHGKMPDVVVHHAEKGWLVLIEAVTSHGPVDPKRRSELKALFKDSRAGLVFVTAFLTRKALMKYLDEIAWETEVWVAESPDHLIHFNGERFLGPYE